MTKKTLPLLLALSLLFSGCLGLFDDDPETDDPDMNGDTNGDNGDTNGDNGGNNGGGNGDNGSGNDTETPDPPVASLSANVTQGTAPLAVSFELGAEHDDPEEVSWELDLGDGSESGKGLPATVEHTFSSVGNYTVVLTVTYGDDSDESELAITVTEAAGGPKDLQEGTNGLCLDYNILYEIPGVEDPLGSKVNVVPGTGFKVSAAEGAPYVDFFNGDGESLGYNDGGTEGVVPEGAEYGIMCVGESAGYPVVPLVDGQWTYQDGF